MSNISVEVTTQAEAVVSSVNGDGDALVLSAGGLFGAYQAGVYKALWAHWRPDIVVGASVGALNGWPIAARIEPDELIEMWFHPDAAATVKFRPRPNLLGGYFDPAPLLDRARRMERDFPRKLPFGIVAIEVPRFRPRIFRDAEITPQHLVATCSIPLFYPSVKVNGMRLLDGGLLESTPVWAAAVMGATRVIAIDALPRLTPWPVHAVLAAMHSIRKSPVPDSLTVAMIRPSGPMGSARQAMVWERANIRRWVQMGIKDGEQFLRNRTGFRR
jgi:predicted acylesterase/phospholipase RssA